MEWDSGFSSSSPEFLLLEEEMEEFRSEKSVSANKTQEEIEQLTVDESLSPVERALLLINTGQDVQKICVIEHLEELLRDHQTDTLCRVLPQLCSQLPCSSVEVQAAGSKVLAEVLGAGLVPVHLFVTACLPTVLQLLETKENSSCGVWLECLLLCLPHLPREVIKRDVLNIAVAKGQLSQTVSSRQACCRIIGAMAAKFEALWLKRELLPLATTLCQDVDREVRRCMSLQLHSISKALGSDVARSCILPELMELSCDEECQVRCAAMEAVADISSLLLSAEKEVGEILRLSIAPLVRKFCERSLADGDKAVLVAARLLGRLCHLLKDVVAADMHDWFCDFYRKLSEYRGKGGVSSHPPTPSTLTLAPAHSAATDAELFNSECRRLCAYNFPAMVLFVGRTCFDQELAATLLSFATDDSYKVKRTLACGLHEVVIILGSDCTKVSFVYQTLLKDQSGEVLLALIEHLPEALVAIAKASNLAPETLQPGLLDFIPALLSCEVVAASCRQWRVLHSLLAHLSCLTLCMTSEQLYWKFVPLLFKYISGSCALPVKLAASQTLCRFIRCIRKAEQRQELCLRIIEECAKSSNSRQRLLFIEICGFILDIFSRSFFKETFFESVLELAHDPVSNVRLRLCKLLPSLKSILKLPGDRVLLQQLELTVRKLISQERDHDACTAIRETVVEMDKIEICMETLTRRTFFEADLTDQEREEEERALLVAEEREREKQAKKTAKAGGKVGQSPRQTRKGGSATSLATILSSAPSSSSPATNSPAVPHKNMSSAAAKRTPSLSITKSLSAPPTSSDGGGASERKSCNSPVHFTVGNSQAKPSRTKKVSPLSSPSTPHPSTANRPSPPKPPHSTAPSSSSSLKPSSAAAVANTATSKLVTTRSRDSVNNKSGQSSGAGRRKTVHATSSSSSSSSAHQQYGLAYSRTSSTGRKS